MKVLSVPKSFGISVTTLILKRDVGVLGDRIEFA